MARLGRRPARRLDSRIQAAECPEVRLATSSARPPPASHLGRPQAPPHLDALVAGAGGHAPPVEVEGDIVDEVLMVRRDAARHEHGHTAPAETPAREAARRDPAGPAAARLEGPARRALAPPPSRLAPPLPRPPLSSSRPAPTRPASRLVAARSSRRRRSSLGLALLLSPWPGGGKRGEAFEKATPLGVGKLTAPSADPSDSEWGPRPEENPEGRGSAGEESPPGRENCPGGGGVS